MENLSHVIGEVFKSSICMIQSYGLIFRDVTTELEIFRQKDYRLLWPKMFFSDVSSFPYSRTVQKKVYKKVVGSPWFHLKAIYQMRIIPRWRVNLLSHWPLPYLSSSQEGLFFLSSTPSRNGCICHRPRALDVQRCSVSPSFSFNGKYVVLLSVELSLKWNTP